jgi:hypothetical protein
LIADAKPAADLAKVATTPRLLSSPQIELSDEADTISSAGTSSAKLELPEEASRGPKPEADSVAKDSALAQILSEPTVAISSKLPPCPTDTLKSPPPLHPSNVVVGSQASTLLQHNQHHVHASQDPPPQQHHDPYNYDDHTQYNGWQVKGQSYHPPRQQHIYYDETPRYSHNNDFFNDYNYRSDYRYNNHYHHQH